MKPRKEANQTGTWSLTGGYSTQPVQQVVGGLQVTGAAWSFTDANKNNFFLKKTASFH